jgi:predicted hydrocarbon binding protein
VLQLQARSPAIINWFEHERLSPYWPLIFLQIWRMGRYIGNRHSLRPRTFLIRDSELPGLKDRDTFFPKEVMTYLYKPGANLFHLAVQLRDVPGALGDLTMLLGKSGINILGGIVCPPKTEMSNDTPFRMLEVFVEAANRELSASAIGSLIESCPYTYEVKVRRSREGLIVDSMSFPLRLGQGQRAILIRKDVISASMREVRQVFSTGGDVMLYKQGYAAGKSDAEELIRIFGEESVLEKLEELVNLYSSLGWGRAKISSVDFETLSAKIKVEQSFECMSQTSPKPYSQFLRGHLAGLTSGVLSTEMKCEETACVSMGNHACEFLLSIS